MSSFYTNIFPAGDWLRQHNLWISKSILGSSPILRWPYRLTISNKLRGDHTERNTICRFCGMVKAYRELAVFYCRSRHSGPAPFAVDCSKLLRRALFQYTLPS